MPNPELCRADYNLRWFLVIWLCTARHSLSFASSKIRVVDEDDYRKIEQKQTFLTAYERVLRTACSALCLARGQGLSWASGHMAVLRLVLRYSGKDEGLAKLKPYERGMGTRYQTNDSLHTFLDAL